MKNNHSNKSFRRQKNHGYDSTEKFSLQTHCAIEIISYSKISVISADGGYTHFHLICGKSILISKPLGAIENTIHHQSIIRVHKSYMVNLDNVASYHPSKGILITVCGHEVPVSLRKQNITKTRLIERAPPLGITKPKP